MTHAPLTLELINQMTFFATHYQDEIMEAMSIQMQAGRGDTDTILQHALTAIMGWRQSFDQATEIEQSSIPMFNDWLERVHKSIGIYDDWLSDYLNAEVM